MKDLTDINTMEDLFRILQDTGAGVVKVILRKEDESIALLVIASLGDEAQEILTAVEEVENSWELAGEGEYEDEESEAGEETS